ncbi:hypothetical protein RJ640_013448 [Escallonia rubra]|uniref:PB1 domain-containing protein n=1 Tax=Escallonia rubra TaxID=112253 RepID=A0AA88RF58_9ASTE|nr:hypothetical protein RJ640_013448 [Escallonia rubra]
MDPPPLPPHPATILNPIATNTSHLNHPDSSPRSRHTNTWDEPLPLVPGRAKLRLMCSYGGHIIPRPHDKSLCYVGGDTRIVVVDRHSSLSDLSICLSRTLLHGRQFALKYQLPSEDLDSLVSIATDEDLDNMIEEYDRTTSTSSIRPSRLRLFLFLAKPETAASMGSLLDDAKSETWFVDALNGAGFLPRGISDSAAIDGLVELDGIVIKSDSCADLEAHNETLDVDKQVNNVSDVQVTTSDWSNVERNSSFGSSSSSPSMSNLPPIQVHVDDQMVGLDEQFSQMSVAVTTVPLSAPSVESGATVNSTAGFSDYRSGVLCEEERLDQGVPGGFRKPPLPLQPVPRKFGHDAYNLPSPDSKLAGGYNLPSPDSVASDTSIASGTSLSKQMVYQEQIRAPAGVSNPGNSISDLNQNAQIQVQQVQDSVYMLHPQQNHQQYFHASTRYVHQPTTGAVPVSSYYPMYAPPQQTDQQYPMYFLPVTQTQPNNYNHGMQPSMSDTTIMASSPALTTPPLYPTKTASPPIPEMAAAGVYRTAANGSLVQVPSSQVQHQYVGFSQMPHPSHPPASNYGYEYAQPTHDQVYYTQHPTAQLPPQYQTMTSAQAVMLSQASAHQHAEPIE